MEQREALMTLAFKLQREGHLPRCVLRWDGQLVDTATGLDEKEMLHSIGFLFDEYAADKWYFVLIMQFFKLLLVSIVGLIPSLPWVKLSWGFFFTVCISFLFLVTKPILDQGLNHYQTFAFVIMGSKLYYGLQLTRDGMEGKTYLTVAGMVIVAFDLILIAYLPLLIVYIQLRAKLKRKGGDDDEDVFDNTVLDGDSHNHSHSQLFLTGIGVPVAPQPVLPEAVLNQDAAEWGKDFEDPNGEFKTVAYC